MAVFSWPWPRGKAVRNAADETKASRVGPIVAFHAAGRPVWTPRDYSALAREGFARNPVVYRAVRMIAEAAASVPWLLYEGAQEYDDHPLLRLLDHPNPRMAGGVLFEEVYGNLLIAGNAYVEAVSVAGSLRELHGLRPDRMKVIPGPQGWPAGFEYTVKGRMVRFDQEGPDLPPILHLTLHHPLNDHYGFPPLEAAQVSLDVHNAASGWSKALLDNSALPSGALIYQTQDGGNLTGDQFERLKQELEDSFSGPRNAGRPLLLEGGLDWKQMSLAPRDMDFIEAKNQAAREIALAFGVPPMLLGIPGDNTYANYQEANRAFWRQTILPLIKRTAGALSAWLSPVYGEGIRLSFDIDAIEALSGEREALWRRVGAADYLTDDEKRAAIGYAPRDGGELSRQGEPRSSIHATTN